MAKFWLSRRHVCRLMRPRLWTRACTIIAMKCSIDLHFHMYPDATDESSWSVMQQVRRGVWLAKGITMKRMHCCCCIWKLCTVIALWVLWYSNHKQKQEVSFSCRPASQRSSSSLCRTFSRAHTKPSILSWGTLRPGSSVLMEALTQTSNQRSSLSFRSKMSSNGFSSQNQGGLFSQTLTDLILSLQSLVLAGQHSLFSQTLTVLVSAVWTF